MQKTICCAHPPYFSCQKNMRLTEMRSFCRPAGCKFCHLDILGTALNRLKILLYRQTFKPNLTELNYKKYPFIQRKIVNSLEFISRGHIVPPKKNVRAVLQYSSYPPCILKLCGMQTFDLLRFNKRN